MVEDGTAAIIEAEPRAYDETNNGISQLMAFPRKSGSSKYILLYPSRFSGVTTVVRAS
jgi:hypothetical protein